MVAAKTAGAWRATKRGCGATIPLLVVLSDQGTSKNGKATMSTRKWRTTIPASEVISGYNHTDGTVIQDMVVDLFTKFQLFSQGDSNPTWRRGDSLFRMVATLLNGERFVERDHLRPEEFLPLIYRLGYKKDSTLRVLPRAVFVDDRDDGVAYTHHLNLGHKGWNVNDNNDDDDFRDNMETRLGLCYKPLKSWITCIRPSQDEIVDKMQFIEGVDGKQKMKKGYRPQSKDWLPVESFGGITQNSDLSSIKMGSQKTGFGALVICLMKGKTEQEDSDG